MMKSLFAGFMLILVVTTESPAIVIRHDRADEGYVEMGQDFEGVCQLNGGLGTLIGRQWVLTAAHVVAEPSPFAQAQFGDAVYTPTEIYLHPTWSGRAGDNSTDMAIVKLERPVEGVAPYALYRWNDEQAQTVIFVGSGQTGDGKQGPTHEDGQQRAATNLCEEVDGDWMRFRFDPPATATEQEGISGPGDSGGPALLKREGIYFIAGVSSSNSGGDGQGHCTYGTDEYYPRVSQALEWIESVLAGTQPPDIKPSYQPVNYEASKLPATPAAAAAKAFFVAWGHADFEPQMRDFEANHRSAAALAQRSIDQRLTSWTDLRAEWGALRPLKFVALDDGNFAVLADGDKIGKSSFRFVLDDEDATRIRGIMIGITK